MRPCTLDPGEEIKVVPTRDGDVTVHAACVEEMISDGTVPADCVDAFAEDRSAADDGPDEADDEWDDETLELADEDR